MQQKKGKVCHRRASAPVCLKATLVFTSRTVVRGTVIANKSGDLNHHVNLNIPLSKCKNCGMWVRVLPLELLPYKRYSITIIAASIDRYVHSLASYRKSCADITISNAPSLAHTSLYRWISGLAEKLLDRDPAIMHKYPPPSSLAIAQTERLLSREIHTSILHTPVLICPDKYRSENRHDQLRAVTRFLMVASLLFGAQQDSLQKWNELLLPSFFVAVWDFPSSFLETPLQQVHPP